MMSKYPVFTDLAEACNAVGLEFAVVQSAQYDCDVIKRVPTIDHPNSKNGWVVPFADGGLLIGNWESGVTVIYSNTASGSKQIGWAEIQACATLAQVHRIKVQREQELRYHQTARLAKVFWNNCFPIKTDYLHPYLERKEVKPTLTMRETDAQLVEEICKVRLMTNNPRVLVIPLIYLGQVVSLQFITEDGGKFFLKGGRTGGCYWPTNFDLTTEHKSIAIAEGVATILSIVQHSKRPMLGISAMNCGNLPRVATVIRSKYPKSKIKIYSDLDANGVGQAKAEEAWHLLSNAELHEPTFTQQDIDDFKVLTGSNKVPTDFNDFYLLSNYHKGYVNGKD